MTSVAVVTGAGSGIGRAVAIALAQRGLRVLAIGRRRAALEETASYYPDQIQVLSADITVQKERERIADVCWTYSGVSVLVHNAGMGPPMGTLASLSLDAWQRHFAINLDAPVFLTQVLLPQLSGGRVLHISSGWAHRPVDGCMAYCTSKAAFHMVYRCLQQELAPKNIAVGSVRPGIVDTSLQKNVRESESLTEKDKQFFQSIVAQHRLIAPNTVAKFLTWLLCDLDPKTYSASEWDIYEESHHPHWLGDSPVPRL